jgi:hypothetical protein
LSQANEEAEQVSGGNSGYSKRRIAGYMNLAPVATCDCGETGCGGVWTRVFVGRERVYWAGFQFWNTEPQPLGPTYDDRLRVFDRTQYDQQLAELVRDINW